uniref:Uncharacterized protein n=1 Tax=Meloidogyne incognita TaxID=6306 RepID=A0A914LXX1_MELIC
MLEKLERIGCVRPSVRFGPLFKRELSIILLILGFIFPLLFSEFLCSYVSSGSLKVLVCFNVGVWMIIRSLHSGHSDEDYGFLRDAANE